MLVSSIDPNAIGATPSGDLVPNTVQNGGSFLPPTTGDPYVPAMTVPNATNRYLGWATGEGSPFQASDIGCRVGSDGWWYDLADGHKLSHAEATAREDVLSSGGNPYWLVSATAGGSTGNKPNTALPAGPAAAVPNASNGSNGNVATLAQTKYGAPAGWTTPSGTIAEGQLWCTPWGTVVSGTAPEVFAMPAGSGITAADASGGGLSAAAWQAAHGTSLPAVTVTATQPTTALPTPASVTNGLPSWAIPAAIGVAVLLVILVVSSKRG